PRRLSLQPSTGGGRGGRLHHRRYLRSRLGRCARLPRQLRPGQRHAALRLQPQPRWFGELQPQPGGAAAAGQPDRQHPWQQPAVRRLGPAQRQAPPGHRPRLLHRRPFFDRIDSRTSQRYAAQAAYSPAAWATLSVDVDAYNAQDNAIDVHDFAHNRSYALAATLLPADKISFESGFTYNSIFSSALVCFTVGSAPSPSNSFACPVAGSPVKLAAIGSYSDLDHFVYADTVIRLVPRTTLRLGFAGSFTRGSSLLLDPLAPAGALQYDYLRPTAGVEFQMAPGTVFSGSWRNYDYGEPGGLPSGLASFPLDNFHANLLTLSLRYSF